MNYAPMRLPWFWEERTVPETSGSNGSSFDGVGVGRFLKDVGLLALPMSIVAGGFALYMNAKLADVKEMVRDAVSAHAQNEQQQFVSRIEWSAASRIDEMRWQQISKEQAEQTLQIRKNTQLLERIAAKVGVKRENGD